MTAQVPARPTATEPPTKAIATVIIAQDRMAMEGLRSMLADTPYTVVGCLATLTESCPKRVDNDVTFVVILGSGLDHHEASRIAHLVRGWRSDHRIVGVLDGCAERHPQPVGYDRLIERSSLGQQVVASLNSVQGNASVRAHVRAQLQRLPDRSLRPPNQDRPWTRHVADCSKRALQPA